MEKSRMKMLYHLVSEENWEGMIRELICSSKDKSNKDVMLLLHPISVHKDNIVHLAVHSKKKEPLKQILEFVDKNMRHSFTSSVNAYGNTVMHEAAICRNLEAVQLLLAENKELLRLENASGETPLFRAAAYGNTKIVKLLAYQEDQIVTTLKKKKQLKDNHRMRYDKTSILRVAVEGKHFGTALELLKLDPELANLEDKDGSDLYYLLDKMSSSLKSGYRMNIWEKILCFCLPIGCGNNDEADNIEKVVLKILQEMSCWHPQWTTFQTRRLEDLPIGCNHNDNGTGNIEKKAEDMEVSNLNSISIWNLIISVSYWINLSIWSFIIAGCPVVKRIWKEKRDYKFAYKLAKKLTWSITKEELALVRLLINCKKSWNGSKVWRK
ncbi:hypothetical protein Q3G72_010546 [Acer saccharum]|nr:hypothetical protein Q3G72_010546 [Acer saccharum]